MDFNTRLLGLHRRNYCSITRVVDEFYKSTDPGQIQAQNKAITRIISEHCISRKERHFHLFGVDCTPNPRVFSPTLEDRGYVYAPNTVAGNTPIPIKCTYIKPSNPRPSSHITSGVAIISLRQQQWRFCEQKIFRNI